MPSTATVNAPASVGVGLGLRAVAFIALGLVGPLMLFSTVDVGGFESLQLLLRVLLILLPAWVLANLIARGTPDWFATVFWTFTYVWIGIAGFAQAARGRDPFGQVITQSRDAEVAFVVLLGLVGWMVVYRSIMRRSAGAKPTHALIVTPTRVIAVFWLATTLTPALLMVLGGPFFFWSSLADAGAGLTEASGGSSSAFGLLQAFVKAPPAVALFGLTLMLQEHRQLRRSPAWWSMIAVTLVLNALVNTPVGSARFWSGTVIIGWLLCFRVFRSRTGYRFIVCSLILGLILVFPYADYFRYSSTGNSVQVRQPYDFFTEKLDYDASAQIANARTTYEIDGAQYGRQLIGAVGFAIPRDFWQDKADPTGHVIARAIGFPFENLSAPLWAEGWVDWGPAGAVLYPSLFALLAGWGDSRFRLAVALGGARVALIALPALAVFTLILVRGSLLATISQGAFLALTLLLLARRHRE